MDWYNRIQKITWHKKLNIFLLIGCLSLGVAYTYYQKKQAEKLAIIEAAKEEEETVDNVEIKEEVPTTE